ncbi:MAG: hypothetical protein U0L47_09250 [Paludibacteraceae bacterium]|nr:hypothetical protein [Paludibacteraceae bacterium]
MKILVNGREAVLKANASFEYVSENPLFTEAEDYTMEIPFPMKDCPQNISIFGPLHVKGVDISKVSFPCEIQTDAFVKSGILTITSVSDTEVKGQFLEGMSQQNFASSLPDVYLTDLDFSQWDGQDGGWEGFPDYTPIEEEDWGIVGYKANKSGPDWGWDEIPVWDKNKEEVILPYEADWGCDPSKSRRIYLAHLIKLIGKAIGWAIDDTPLRSIEMYRYILVANARSNYTGDHNFKVQPLAKSLPRWKLIEFLEQLSLFFGVVYEIDVNRKTVVLKANKTITQSKAATGSLLSIETLDDFTVELVEEEKKSYRGNITLRLPDQCNPNGINSCPNIINDPRIPHKEMLVKTFSANLNWAADTYSSNMPADATEFGESMKYLYYFTDIDRWAIVTESLDKWFLGEGEEGEQPDARFQMAEIINQYGPLTGDKELKIAPCPLEFIKYYPQKSPISSEKDQYWRYADMPALEIPIDPQEVLNIVEMSEDQRTSVVDYLSQGEIKEEDMYYDYLWLVIYKDKRVFTREYEPLNGMADMIYWDDKTQQWLKVMDDEGNTELFPLTTGFRKYDYTLSPFDSSIQEIRVLPKVDETKLYRYKFLAKTLPSPTSVFLIKGKRYACLKLTAQITVKGMSELVEGEFFEIID